MVKKVKVKDWVAALRSGKYKQGRNVLRTSPYATTEVAFCCLGVLADIKGAEWEGGGYCSLGAHDKEYTLLKPEILRMSSQNRLASMNDGGRDFTVIADHIERYYDMEKEL